MEPIADPVDCALPAEFGIYTVAQDSRELADALFRCAHTIKGSAGLFGLDEIVAFTHHVETFLDALREGTVQLAPAVNDVLLRCADQVRRLVAQVDDSPLSDGAATDDREALIAALAAILPGAATAERTRAGDPTPRPAGATKDGTTSHHIALHFKTDTFRDGFDPLAILEYLATVGTLHEVEIDADRLPGFDVLHAEDCHLDLSLMLVGELDAAQVEAAFDLFREDCVVRDTAAGMGSQEALGRIAGMDESPRIGEILVAAGRGSPQRHAAAADDARRRDLRALPARGARHGVGARQGRAARDRRRRHRARQVGGRTHRRSADAPGAQRARPRPRAARRARGRR
jgi:chemotaxis protein histidine kinase CheA